MIATISCYSKITRNIADMKPFQFRYVDLRADRHSSNIKYNPLPNKMTLNSIHCQHVEENLNRKLLFLQFSLVERKGTMA